MQLAEEEVLSAPMLNISPRGGALILQCRHVDDAVSRHP